MLGSVLASTPNINSLLCSSALLRILTFFLSLFVWLLNSCCCRRAILIWLSLLLAVLSRRSCTSFSSRKGNFWGINPLSQWSNQQITFRTRWMGEHWTTFYTGKERRETKGCRSHSCAKESPVSSLLRGRSAWSLWHWEGDYNPLTEISGPGVRKGRDNIT